MEILLPYLPHLSVMAILVVASAFFSCSEAALFYLPRDERRRMAQGSIAERSAASLLNRPDRVLTSILFWNLVINMGYFALASVIAIDLTKRGAAPQASVFTVAALLAVIIFCEMFPKNLGVVWPRRLATLVSLPLSVATRVLDPIAEIFRMVNRGSVRVLLPNFQPEPYLDLGDLERAIDLSSGDQQVINQEHAVLSRIVALADMRIEEIMRPRLLYEAITPPALLSALTPQAVASGYVLLTEPDSEEIAAVIDANHAALAGADCLDPLATPVLPAPWCASAADTLSRMDASGREVAAVINELGETIGIVTYRDLLGNVLQSEAAHGGGMSRVGRITTISDGCWEVTGMTTLRRLAKQLRRKLPVSKGITVAGMLQEQLNRIPEEDDEVDWADLRWRVVRADHPTLLTASVSVAIDEDESTN